MGEGDARGGREVWGIGLLRLGWVRVRAAFLVTGSCVLRETILRVVRGCGPRVSLFGPIFPRHSSGMMELAG